MFLRLQWKKILILGCILFFSLQFHAAIAAPSSESFEITVQPIYHFLEPANMYEYTNIIKISSTSPGQLLAINWITTSPFLEVVYEDSIQLDETGKATIGYTLQVEETIPSGNYQIEYEINNQAGIAYGGNIPIRVYRVDDADVVDIELQAISPFNDVRYSQVEINVQYDGDWRVLTPSVDYNHSLRLIAGEYSFIITDIITGVQIKDFKTITSTDQDAIFQYIFPLIQFDLLKISFDEINFAVSNFLGVQNANLILKNTDGNVLANYKFVINNGINQFSFPMPKNVTTELELILSVNSYSQGLTIELSNEREVSEEFPLAVIAVIPLFLVGIAKIVVPHLPFNRKSAENLIKGEDNSIEIEEDPADTDDGSIDVGNVSAD